MAGVGERDEVRWGVAGPGRSAEEVVEGARVVAVG